MVRHINSRRSKLAAVVVLALLSVAAPALAQTHRLGGVVTDIQGKPVEGAQVTISQVDGSSKYTAKTDKNGQFNQIGLLGNVSYSVTVAKDKLTATRVVRVTGGAVSQTRADFTLAEGVPNGI